MGAPWGTTWFHLTGAVPEAWAELAAAGAIYRPRRVDEDLLDTEAWELERDIWTLSGLMDELSAELPRKAEILRALETVVDRMDEDPDFVFACS